MNTTTTTTSKTIWQIKSQYCGLHPNRRIQADTDIELIEMIEALFEWTGDRATVHKPNFWDKEADAFVYQFDLGVWNYSDKSEADRATIEREELREHIRAIIESRKISTPL